MVGRPRGTGRKAVSTRPSHDVAPRTTRRSVRLAAVSAEPETRATEPLPRRGVARQQRAEIPEISTSDFTRSDNEDGDSPEPVIQALSPVLENVGAQDASEKEMDVSGGASDLSPAEDGDRIEDLPHSVDMLSACSNELFEYFSSISSYQPAIKESEITRIRKIFEKACRPFLSENEEWMLFKPRPKAYTDEQLRGAQVAVCSGNLMSLLTDMVEGTETFQKILGRLDSAWEHLFNDLVSEDSRTAMQEEIRAVLSGQQPMDNFRLELSSWCLKVYRDLNPSSNHGICEAPSPTGDDNARTAHNAPESTYMKSPGDAADDSDEESDSEPGDYEELIPDPQVGNDRTYINDATREAVKQSEKHRLRSAPPSNQQAEKGKQMASGFVEAIRRLDVVEVLNSSHPPHPSGSVAIRQVPQKRGLVSHPRVVSGESSRQKRSHIDENAGTDVDDDADFETMSSRKSESNKRRQLLANSSVRNARYSGSPSPAPDRQTGEQTSQDDAVEGDFGDLSQAARENRRLHRENRPVQTRTPWSENDIRTLIRLIADYGCQWARIERDFQGEFEVARDQQAFRDKARNLKVDYLSSDDTRLPPGFEYVALGQKEIAKIERAGRVLIQKGASYGGWRGHQ